MQRLARISLMVSATLLACAVEATFARAPSEPLSFRTVNGEVDVTFPPNLSADLA